MSDTVPGPGEGPERSPSAADEAVDRQPSQADLLAQAEALVLSTEQIRRDIAADRARVKRDRKVYLTLICFIVFGVVSTFGLALLNRVTYTTIRDCVDVEGKCYQEGQARQSDIIGIPPGPINSVAVATALCAAANPPDGAKPTDAEIAQNLRCTTEVLAVIKNTGK